MGKTRDLQLARWSVFEGDEHVSGLVEALGFREDVNRPVKWPVTLRVNFFRGRILYSRDVEIHEDLSVKVGAAISADAWPGSDGETEWHAAPLVFDGHPDLERAE